MTNAETTSANVQVATDTDAARQAAQRILAANRELTSLNRLKKAQEAIREEASMVLLGQTENRKETPSPILSEGAIIEVEGNNYEFSVGARSGPALRQAWDAIYNTLPNGGEEQGRMDTAMTNSESTSYLAAFELHVL